MTNMMRLPDEKALNELLARTKCRVVRQLDKRKPAAVKKERLPKLAKAPKPRSEIEEVMWRQLVQSSLPKPLRQHLYVSGRKFRSDFAWPDRKLALEVDGGVHRIKSSFKSGFERGYVLLLTGWKVLHVGGEEVRNDLAIKWIQSLFVQSAFDRYSHQEEVNENQHC